MKNKDADPQTPLPVAAGLLDGPVVAALLEAMGCHAFILDLDLRLLAFDPGAPAALGLGAGPGGPDIVPLLARTRAASRGYRLCGAPLPLGGGPHLWVFQDARGQERREELEMIFLHELLGTLGPRCGGEAPELWETALGLYREVVVPRLALDRRREVPGARALEQGGEPRCEAAAAARAHLRSAPKVLVVDDSTMVRRLLAAVLGREFRVLAAEDGDAALALALEARPDLILLDALMPGMDGFTACERLKADARTGEIPVLFLTALDGEVDEIRALEAGAIDFIQKPINAATVLARVRNHIELKRSNDRLRELSVQDGLTSLSNRRHFDQVLTREWQRCRREGSPLALILGDVDCFKNYNDTYGHLEGDACLKAVAAVFAGALRRPADMAARFGGEEFVCLLPDTDEAGARAVAEQISAALADLGLPHAGSDVAPHVTASLGVAAVCPAQDDLPGSLVDEADRRMYEAKRKAKARHLRA